MWSCHTPLLSSVFSLCAPTIIEMECNVILKLVELSIGDQYYLDSCGKVSFLAQNAKTAERHVFLLDGLTVCCKAKAKGGVKDKQYRFKEKINMKKVTLVDLPESDG